MVYNIVLIFIQNVSPDPSKNCGPYTPNTKLTHNLQSHTSRENNVILKHASSEHTKKKTVVPLRGYNPSIAQDNHDTVGMVVIDQNGNVAAGTSTNGLRFKVPGYVMLSQI